MGNNVRLLESLEARHLMAAGELDPTFGTGGVLNVAEGVTSAEVEVLPDGRIITAERPWTDFDEPRVIVVRRLLPDGTPDPTFGSGGAVTLTGIAGMPDDVTAVAPAAGGKLLVAGRFAVMRLNANGSLDTTFAGPARGHDDAQAGVALVPGTPFGLAVAPDGRIGIVGNTSTFAFATVLTPSGAFDEDFDEGGSIHWGTNQQGVLDIEYEGRAAAFRPDGALVVGGVRTETFQMQESFSREQQWVVRAFDESGNSVDLNGSSADPAPEETADLAVLADGSILALAIGAENRSIRVARFDPAGNMDSTFGASGFADVTPIVAAIDRFQGADIEVLPDGRFYVLARETAAATGVQLHLARFLADGAMDPSYAGHVAVVPPGQTIDYGALSLRGDDALVLSREDLAGANGDDFKLRKFDGNGPRLTRNGTLLVSGTSGADTISITRRARDGRILADVGGGEARVFLPQLVKRIQIYAHGGDDVVTIGPNVRSAFIDGADGNDTLTGGDGNDLLLGGVGNDSLIGGIGHDELHGNAGNDYLLGAAGNDVIHGHGGRDTLLGTLGNDQLFGGPGSADHVYGGLGEDAAANDPLDTYEGVEELLG